MKLDPISVWAKYRERLAALLRSVSLSSRITGGACILALLVLLLAPSYAKILPTIFVGITAFAWLMSVLFHSLKRASANGVPTHNPFTLPLFAVIVLFILGLAYSRTSLGMPTYYPNNEPINELFAWLETIAAEDGQNMPQSLSRVSTWLFDNARSDYNILLLGEDGEILYNKTNRYSGGSRKLYPLVSPGTSRLDSRLLVLVNEREQVIGTFMIQWYDSPSDSAPNVPFSTLTLPAQGESDPAAQQPAAEQSTFDKLYRRYFPSFGSVIDAYVLQLCTVEWMVVTDTSAPYRGEIINREYATKDISFLEWNGEPIEHLHTLHISSEEERLLINALNALSEAERIALVEHARWLHQADKSAVSSNGNPTCAQVFATPSGTQRIVLLYENAPGLYPLLQARQDQWAFCNQVFVAAMMMIPVYWILLAFWVFTDAKRRGQRHPALWGVLTMIGNVIALIVYNMVRPQMRVDKSGKKQPRGVCPLCGAVLKCDFIACPGCGILLRSKCKNCHRALENDWNFCPYCTRQILPEALPEADVSEAAGEDAPMEESSTEEAPLTEIPDENGEETA
jgi:hypothetical protein